MSSFLYRYEYITYLILVPMDLDVKMKAVMIGACMLIVSAMCSV